ncbi:MAG: FumA C-terminus/TtdB family hydratase beta subunit [Candidatus Undinarchaeales archaeon]|nr:FumA C-terminus/TtdB family hydratase beta subunit [Candidatus Undinarchaeales archaeon]MDP7492809.1 FumA C-terminus/TtdB family hydratase beta subunit [Candidatus Undinarchaeales archaeon]
MKDRNVIRLKVPLTRGDVSLLKVGDRVLLSGTIVTARDRAHRRIIEVLDTGTPLPVDLTRGVIFHCGPLVRKDGPGWHVVSAGPTTSARLDELAPEVIHRCGVRAIIGKGGMGSRTATALQNDTCVYLAMTGGTAALGARAVRRVREVHWLDLGMPEALWVMDVEDLGPLTVAMDAHGGDLYDRATGAHGT